MRIFTLDLPDDSCLNCRNACSRQGTPPSLANTQRGDGDQGIADEHDGEIPVHRAAWACGQAGSSQRAADTEWIDTKWVEEQSQTLIEAGTGDHARCGCGRTENTRAEYDLKAAPGMSRSDACVMGCLACGAEVAALASDSSPALEPSRQEGRDWSLTHQFAAVFGAFTLFALIGALPRGLVLLALSRLSPSVSMQDVLAENMGFGDIMTGCKVKDQVWTDLSQGGQFHRSIVIADYSLAFIGSSMAYVAAIHVTFPVRTWRLSPRATNSMKGLFFILAACNLVVCLYYVVQSLGQNLAMALSGPRQSHKQFNWCLFAIIIVSFLLFSFLSRTKNDGPTTSKVERLWLVVGRLRITLAIGLILIFCFFVNDVQKEVLRVAGDWARSDWDYQFFGVFAPVVLGKTVLMVLRIETRERSSLLLTTAMMLSFLGNTFASLSARRFMFEENDGLVINCTVMGAVEILTRGSAFWFRVLMKGKELQRSRINAQTLDGLLDLNDGIRYEIDSHSGHMFIDQVSEIAVCVTMAIQYLCVPEWVTRRSLQDYQDRVRLVGLFYAVQILFEVSVDYVIVQVTYRGRESLVHFLELCKRLLWNRDLILFCFGIMTYHGITFWPKCTSCQKPIECLLYIECGRGQPVKIGAQDNVCLQYRGFTNNTEFELLAIHNNQRNKHGLTQNLTLEDLGCLREDVQCHTLVPNVYCSHVDCIPRGN
jgi:hypothetical protein